MTRRDTYASGVNGFAWDETSTHRSSGKAYVVIGVAIVVLLLSGIAVFERLDRPTMRLPGDTLSPVWLRAPAQGFGKVPR